MRSSAPEAQTRFLPLVPTKPRKETVQDTTTNELPRLPMESGENSIVAEFERMAELYWDPDISEATRHDLCLILLNKDRHLYMNDATVENVVRIAADMQARALAGNGDLAKKLKRQRETQSKAPPFSDDQPVIHDEKWLDPACGHFDL